MLNASIYEVQQFHIGRERARARLERARLRARRSAGSSACIRVLDARELDCAIAVAEEWEVIGRRGGS